MSHRSGHVQPAQTLPIQNLQIVETLARRATPAEQIQPIPHARQRHTGARVGQHPTHTPRSSGTRPNARFRVQNVHIVQPLPSVPTPKHDQFVHPTCRILDNGGAVIRPFLRFRSGGRHNPPRVTHRVQRVQIIQIIFPVPTPENPNLRSIRDIIGAVHVARSGCHTPHGGLMPTQQPRSRILGNVQHVGIMGGEGTAPEPSANDADGVTFRIEGGGVAVASRGWGASGGCGG
mmetsp:Transcript_36044/g.41780  ORF Transcript_36044/g.41780 Transcript_36044/m.41780 type:complete len:233 (-) Transcript_36044:556-1254(-)